MSRLMRVRKSMSFPSSTNHQTLGRLAVSQSNTTCNAGNGYLDTNYPYASGRTTDDNPSLELLPEYTKEETGGVFRMYAMWNPQVGSAPLPVPLGFIDWNWSGTAVQDLSTGVWSVASSNVTAGAFLVTATEPTWSDYVNGGGHGISCHY